MICSRKVFPILCTLVLICSSGCATRGYLRDRAYDDADIFTIYAGYGGGAKTRIGPFQAGLLMDVGRGGLRGGDILGVSDFWYKGSDTTSKMDLLFGVVGIEAFDARPIPAARGKCFASKQIIISEPINFRDDPKKAAGAKKMGWVYNPLPYYTQIDVVAGLGLNLRIGFNPGELIDFILGWTTLDLYNDDIGLKEENKEQSNNGIQTDAAEPRR